MRRSKLEVVVHRFYAGDKNVWVAEWPEQYSVEELKEKAAQISADGYGEVDIVTDTKGRLVRIKE